MSAPASVLIGGNRWITNPKQLANLLVPESAVSIKTNATTTIDPTAAGFYTNFAYRGASGAITVADEYITLCDLTGPGFFFSAVLPTHSAAYRPTALFTVDGVDTTISPTADASAADRFIIGAMTSGAGKTATGTAATAGDVIVINGARDGGFSDVMVGGVPSSAAGFISIPTPEFVLASGMAALRFETGFKLQVKASLLSGTATQKQCGVTYRMDL